MRAGVACVVRPSVIRQDFLLQAEEEGRVKGTHGHAVVAARAAAAGTQSSLPSDASLRCGGRHAG
jgi:hypothetical protein